MLPHLTAHLPGTGGQFKTEPEDFRVEEIPRYQPSGEGQHVYATIEKRGLTTYAAIKMLAQALSISSRRIGYAGLKDAHALTRQTLSLDNVEPEAVARLDWPNLKILEVSRHRNKLKLGHLAGNRFVIRIRAVEPEALPTARSVLDLLAQQGVPNYFGEQRFGSRHNTHRLGEYLVRGDTTAFIAELLGQPQPDEIPAVQEARARVDAGQWAAALQAWPRSLNAERRVLTAIVEAGNELQAGVKALDRKLKGLFFSAYQSYLFNRLLSHRVTEFLLTRLQTGDIAYLHRNGAAFLVENAAIEQPRADAFEISPAGPLFGPRLLPAEGEPGQREAALLAEQGLSLDDFKVPGVKLRGARRPYRIKLTEPQTWWDEGLMLSFTLEPGAYATIVLTEIMK